MGITRRAIRADPIVAGALAGPVPALRARAGLSISELGSRLIDRLSLDRANTPRATGYLERVGGRLPLHAPSLAQHVERGRQAARVSG